MAQTPGRQGIDLRINITLVSPVSRLFRSYFPPSDEETQLIQDTISTAKQEVRRLKELSGRIPRHTSRLHDATYREFQKLIREVYDFVRQHQLLLSSLRILPTELMILIFTFCIQPINPAQSNLGLSIVTLNQPLHTAFRLSHVCQRWRSIALDTSQLWVHLAVDLDRPDTDQYLHFLHQVLKRSKNTGLHLFLRDYSSSDLPQSSQHFRSSIVTCLGEQPCRFTTLVMQTSVIRVNTFCTTCDSLRTSSNSVTFLRLRRIVFELYGNAQSNMIINGFARTPALRDVALLGMLVPRLSLPWTQLHTYIEDKRRWSNTVGTLPAVLSLAKDLDTLYVGSLQYHVEPWSPQSKNASNLIKLTDITLDFPSSDTAWTSVYSLVTYFYFPAVKTLRIKSCYFEPLDILLSIARGHYAEFPIPFSNLTQLYYRTTVHTPSNFIEFLKLVPNLQDLDIELPPYECSKKLIENYFYTTLNSKLVPALKRAFINIDSAGWNKDFKHYVSLLLDITKILCLHLRHTGSSPQLQLIFDRGDPSVRNTAKAYLNKWFSIAGAGNLYFSSPLLSPMRHDLDKELLLMGRQTQSVSGQNATSVSLSSRRVDEILTNIEKEWSSSIPSLVRHVHISELHLSLHRLSCLAPGNLPEDRKYDFRSRAKKIIESWEPAHRQKLSSPKTQIFWAPKGMRSLVFIPINDPLRTGPDAMKLIYGMNDDLVEGI